MTIKVFITIDTEEDHWNNYRRHNNKIKNLEGIPRLQNLFNRYGAIPTYLINYPVVTNAEAMHILLRFLDSGQCDIGMHCHPWNTPPLTEELNHKNTMLCNLPPSLQRAKLENLHETISRTIGKPSICFRAGRWGFAEETAKCIQDLGYLIDTSVTPYTAWTHIHGPDFSEIAAWPYRFDPDNITLKKNSGSLLEIPASIGFIQKNQKLCARVRKWIINNDLHRYRIYPLRYRILPIIEKLRILDYRWLSPERNDGCGMTRLANFLINRGHRILNMFFHSTALLPGNMPSIRTQNDLDNFYKDIEIFLKYAVENNMIFLPLSKAAKEEIFA